jgi:heme/copper-type cytochrome/quinol oxidase subunit 2
MLSLFLPVLKSIRAGLQNDVTFWPIILVGAVVILIVGAVIIVLIVLAVKYLNRIRNNKTKDD